MPKSSSGTQRLVTFTPYIWVSNDLALANGRAFYGFSKSLGAMTMPEGEDDETPFALDTLVVPRFGPRSSSEERRLLTVRRTARGGGGLYPLLRSGADLLGTLLSGAGRGGPLSLARAALASPRGMRMVFLKQLPDAADPRRACYQGVIEADVRITTGVQAAPLGGAWEAVFETYDTHRIAQTLGLQARAAEGRASVVQPMAQWRAQFGAVIEPGQVVWEAGRLQPAAGLDESDRREAAELSAAG
jgi:hypothetical protein